MRRDHLRNEAAYLPESVEDLADLRRRVIAAGYPQQTASGIVGWLVAKAAGDPDLTSAPTRSQYRKILAELDDSPNQPVRQLEVVASSGAPARRRRVAPGTRRLSAVVVALAMTLGAGASQARTGAQSGQSGAADCRPSAENPWSRRRSVKLGRRAA